MTNRKDTYTIEDSFTIGTPTLDNYSFVGWTGTGINAGAPSITIPKGSMGPRTYTAQWTGNFTEKVLEPYSPGDTTVSYTFDRTKGYTITEKGGTSGWGVGALGDDANSPIPWGYTYMLSIEIYVPEDSILKLDTNATPVAKDHSAGNDVYGDVSFYIDDVLRASTSGTTLETAFNIPAGAWHKAKIYMKNNSEVNNPNHTNLYSYCTFGLDLTNVSHNVTYQMRNIQTAIY